MTRPILHASLVDHADLHASIGALLPEQAFSRTERVVLDIAWNEAQTREPRDSRLHRVMRRIFGGHDPLPLGNEKLEALRRYGMQLRRLGARAVPAAATAALMAAGYGAEQISVLQMTFSAFSGGISAPARKDA
jgi:hypothetical protein